MLGRVKLNNALLTCEQGNLNHITTCSHNRVLVSGERIVHHRCAATSYLQLKYHSKFWLTNISRVLSTWEKLNESEGCPLRLFFLRWNFYRRATFMGSRLEPIRKSSIYSEKRRTRAGTSKSPQVCQSYMYQISKSVLFSKLSCIFKKMLFSIERHVFRRIFL